MSPFDLLKSCALAHDLPSSSKLSLSSPAYILKSALVEVLNKLLIFNPKLPVIPLLSMVSIPELMVKMGQIRPSIDIRLVDQCVVEHLVHCFLKAMYTEQFSQWFNRACHDRQTVGKVDFCTTLFLVLLNDSKHSL